MSITPESFLLLLPLPLHPQANMNLLSVTIDLLFLDSYRNRYTVCILFRLDFFPQCLTLGFIPDTVCIDHFFIFIVSALCVLRL